MLAHLVFSLYIAASGGPVGVNHATEGMIRARVGDWVGAMESFRMARSSQMSKEAYMAWGTASMKMGKYRSAAAKFGMASGHDPKDGDPLALMGECYLRAGAPREAIASFARIRERSLSDPVGVKILWGSANNMAGAYAQGLALFRQAGEQAPPERMGEIVRGEATSLLALESLDEAERILVPYVSGYKDDGMAIALLGELRLKQGAYDEAARLLHDGLAKNVPVGPTAYNLACAESRRHRLDEACAALARSCGAGFDCRTPMKDDPDLAAVRQRGCPKFTW